MGNPSSIKLTLISSRKRASMPPRLLGKKVISCLASRKSLHILRTILMHHLPRKGSSNARKLEYSFKMRRLILSWSHLIRGLWKPARPFLEAEISKLKCILLSPRCSDTPVMSVTTWKRRRNCSLLLISVI